MRQQGKNIIIEVAESDLQLSTAEIAKKYNVSRITGWRIKYRGQRTINRPQKENISQISIEFAKAYSEKFDDIAKHISSYFEFVTIQDAQDCVSDALVRVLTNSYRFENERKFLHLIKSQAFNFARDIEKKRQKFKEKDIETYI